MLLASGLVGVVSYIVYTWRKRRNDSDGGGEAAHTPQFTGTLQPQAGPVTPHTPCSAAVVVTLPAAAYTAPSGDGVAAAPIAGVAKQVAELQEALAAETRDASSLVTVAFSPAAWAALSPHEAKVRVWSARGGGCGPSEGGEVVCRAA